MFRIFIKKKKFFVARKDGTVYTKGGVFAMFRKNTPFALPAGTYFSTELLQPAKKQSFSTKIAFYGPEKHIPFLGIRKLIFRPNPNKCSIYTETGVVVFDTGFWNELNNVQRMLILSHEMGHYFYHTEFKCDLFATAMLLLMGYNPSQVHAALASTVFDKFRKKENLLQLTKNQ